MTTDVHSGSTTAWHSRSSERTRYFARQTVSAEDLTLDQEYFRNKLRRHNRYLHGWGVVCGALLKEAADPWSVLVTSGYILGPYGDEIYIDRQRCLDIRKGRVEGTTGDDCAPPPDPWCSEAPRPATPGRQVFIAVRYKEFKARPIRVQSCGCGCSSDPCEYSRWRDGYELAVLDECPTSHTNPPRQEPATSGPAPECPPCPDEPWVVLGTVTPDEEGRLTINTCECRRQVKSFATFWWNCSHP